MGRGYSTEEIRQKIISVLSDSESGMSGVEIAQKIKINRITMAKYLKIFAAGGLLRQKELGNITLWYLEPGQEAYVFPDDYFRVASQYLDLLVKGPEDLVFSLIRNCLDSNARKDMLVLEVILPAVDAVSKLFHDGKIGTAERNLLRTTISKSLQIFNQIKTIHEPKKNVVLIAADSDSKLVCEAAAAIYHSAGWRVFDLGDMSMAADVLFDLDFQKLIGKVWKQKPGILITVVFSGTEEGFNFFTDSTRPAKERIGKQMKLVLCGKTSAKSDLASDDIKDILQWSESVFEDL